MSLIGRQRVATLHARARTVASERRLKERVFYESPLGMLEAGWWVSHEDGPNDGPYDSKEEALKASRRYEEEEFGG